MRLAVLIGQTGAFGDGCLVSPCKGVHTAIPVGLVAVVQQERQAWHRVHQEGREEPLHQGVDRLIEWKGGGKQPDGEHCTTSHCRERQQQPLWHQEPAPCSIQDPQPLKISVHCMMAYHSVTE